MAKPRKQSEAGRIIWTGKNLADVRKFHKDVEHYPREEGDNSYRDPSQHHDNLHIEAQGQTLIAAPGDTLVRDRLGRVWVQETAVRRPEATGVIGDRQYQAEGREGSRAKGGTQ